MNSKKVAYATFFIVFNLYLKSLNVINNNIESDIFFDN